MKLRGFTLIELMIVVAVIAIIAAIAFPSYQSQVQKTRRADAQSALLQTAQALERCFTRTNTYVGCFEPNVFDSPDRFYRITVDAQATSFVLDADPRGPQATDNCGTFTLDHRGNPGSDGDVADRCWGS